MLFGVLKTFVTLRRFSTAAPREIVRNARRILRLILASIFYEPIDRDRPARCIPFSRARVLGRSLQLNYRGVKRIGQVVIKAAD